MAVYKKIEIIGTSKNSIEEAIKEAVKRASQTIRNLKWFEIKEIRGAIEDSDVSEFQVVLQVAFRLEDDEKL